MTVASEQLREATTAYLNRTGRTTAALAASVGMQRSHLSAWLHGRRALPQRYWAPLGKIIRRSTVRITNP